MQNQQAVLLECERLRDPVVTDAGAEPKTYSFPKHVLLMCRNLIHATCGNMSQMCSFMIRSEICWTELTRIVFEDSTRVVGQCFCLLDAF